MSRCPDTLTKTRSQPKTGMQKRFQSISRYIVGSILLIWAVFSIESQIRPQTLPPIQVHETPRAIELVQSSEEELGAIASLVDEFLNDGEGPNEQELTSLDIPLEGVYISLRADGIEQSTQWAIEGSLYDLLSRGLGESLGNITHETVNAIDSVELCLVHSYQQIPLDQIPSNIDRGIIGLRFRFENEVFAIPQTEMIAKNLSFRSVLTRFLEQMQISEDQFGDGGIVEMFKCEQVIVFLEPRLRAERMVRGNQLTAIDNIDFSAVEHFAELASSWMAAHIHEDGRLTYKYWPSRGEESEANNMIRQWMASLAIDRIIDVYGEPGLASLAQLNLDYNLEHFYLVENGLGLIEYNENVKLGAAALAGLAILEHPSAANYSAELDSLMQTVDYLWQEDGSFHTFYRPENRIGENQNFYPGEALLFWSELYEQSQDPELLDKFMLSFRYYRNWHRENQNPAFIPWHTQAYYKVWKITNDEELKAFIFEMNDWLLDFQEIERSKYPDTEGRFYDPDKPYGPPHASSTGVYLEGLVDAYLLAKESGDAERQENYARAIRYGIRSLAQLQFADEIDMYYVNQRDNVVGGLRTTVYDNSIRIDNVQHGLMAILKILSIPEAEDIFQ